MSRWLLNRPKPAGATAIPQGALSLPRDAAREEEAVGIEHVDETQPGTCHLVVTPRLAQGVSDVEVSLQIHDIERRETRRNRRIGEAARHGRRYKRVVEDIDLAVVEVGRIQAKMGAVS